MRRDQLLWQAVDTLSRYSVLLVDQFDCLARSFELSCVIEETVTGIGAKVVSARGETDWPDGTMAHSFRELLRTHAEYAGRVDGFEQM